MTPCSRVPHRQVPNIRLQLPISTQIREIDEKSINSAQKSAIAALDWLQEAKFPSLFVPVVWDAVAEAFEREAVGDVAIHDGADDVGREVGQLQAVV